MFLTRKHLSRRTVLKGAGATYRAAVAGRHDSGRNGAGADRRGSRVRGWASSTSRMARCRMNGSRRRPAATSTFPFILEPLEPVREYVTVVSGLRNKGGESCSPHGIIEETWLNCVSPRQRNAKTGVGVTVDQIAARHLGKDTPLPSLELCGEPGGMISFRTPDAAAADGKQSAQGVLSACSGRATRRKSARPS